MSLTAAPLSIDVVNGFIRSLGCNPDRVEEVRITRDRLDIVTTAEDGCSETTHHRLVESPTAAAVRDAVERAAVAGQRVAVLFNSQVEAAAALRAVYDRRGAILEGFPHIFYLAAGRLSFRDSGGSVDFVNVNGSAYRGQSWDLAYHPFDTPARVMENVIPAVPSGRFIAYGAAA